jgi:hypothetical protein
MPGLEVGDIPGKRVGGGDTHPAVAQIKGKIFYIFGK